MSVPDVEVAREYLRWLDELRTKGIEHVGGLSVAEARFAWSDQLAATGMTGDWHELTAQIVVAYADRERELVGLLREVFADPTLALGYAVTHHDLHYNDETDEYEGTGAVTHTEPEGHWRKRTRELLAALDNHAGRES